MAIGELSSLSVATLADLVRTRRISPVEIIEDVLAHVDVLQPKLNAFVLIDHDGARKAARQAEVAVTRGDPLGALHGVPVTIKDNAAVAGLAVRKGSRLTDAAPAAKDAVAVARLRKAGAIIVGKTAMPEQGWKATSDSPLTGSTHNPWRHGFTAGGSSAGAAALAAAGCMPIHLGTDGAGSVRLPGHFCGVVGFKPTFGTVPYTPVFNNNAVSHIGPIARSVADVEAMLEVMAGLHPLDPGSHPLGYRAERGSRSMAGLRIGYSADLGHARVDPEVATLVEAAARLFEDLGAHVEAVTPAWGPKGPALGRQMWGAWLPPLKPADAETERAMDQGLAACIAEYVDVTWGDVQAALGRRLAYAAEIGLWFAGGFDLLITPAASVAAFPTGLLQPPHWPVETWDWLKWAEFAYPFNLAHCPAASVPCGLTPDGLPVGLQIVAARYADPLVMRAAAAFLEARPFAYPKRLSQADA